MHARLPREYTTFMVARRAETRTARCLFSKVAKNLCIYFSVNVYFTVPSTTISKQFN